MQFATFANYHLQGILSETNYSLTKTKIICTIGPSCWDTESLCSMLENGMTVARLNFSHGDHQAHGETVKKLKEAFKLKKHLPCAILLDTKGPEIRTGLLKEKSVTLKSGQKLEITTDYDLKGDSSIIACSYLNLPKSVQVGGQILIADGTLVCIVDEIKETSVIVTVQNDVSIGEKKNMNLPGCKVDLPTVTEKDEKDIIEFGLKHGIDMIALSFTRSAKDIETVRELLGPRGDHIKIISKIENQEGLHNYDEILEATDGIMVARGDLGMEIPPQKVFLAQKWMIKKALAVGKPVVTATQMMESMIKNPRPTRAEASDVANAVLDGTDCVMLSGETANGSFPVQCVRIMSQICREAELCFDNQQAFWTTIHNAKQLKPIEALGSSAVQISFQINSPIMVVFTASGLMARTVAKYRPKATVIAVSTEQSTIKSLTCCFGVKCLRVPTFQGNDKLISYAIDNAKELGFCKKGDKIVVLLASSEDDDDSEETDVLKIKTVN